MTPFFTRERFGRPQVYAGLLLLAFIGQCLWLMGRVPLSLLERAYVEAGRQQWRGEHVAGDVERSPLVPLIAGAPTLLSGEFEPAPPAVPTGSEAPRGENPWRWLVRLPFLVMGALLGASLWYVARRLYGNTGGYIALALYVFSPAMIVRSATVRPDASRPMGERPSRPVPATALSVRA